MSGVPGGLPAALPEPERALLRAVPGDDEPEVRPMLATLSARRSFDDRWIFERKLDGVRVLAVCRPGARPHLLSRTGRSIDATYPEVVDALAGQPPGSFTVDGEIVALHAGRTDFSLLQQRMGLTRPHDVRASPVVVTYYVFDLLALDGQDLTRLPLRTRKSLLRSALDFRDPVRFTAHRNPPSDGGGAAGLLDQACGKGWEGLIAKRADAPYRPRRSGDWLKLKCEAGQEFVIGGFTEPAGSRIGFGALLLGYYGEGRPADPADPTPPDGTDGTDRTGSGLIYAGKVGTGWSDRALRDLRRRLDELRSDRSPFAGPVRERGAHWVAPALVAQVGFSEWTRDGLLRHPRFLGLRDDKEPSLVVRERPAAG
jgi:ATP-dependent DNA ligase